MNYVLMIVIAVFCFHQSILVSGYELAYQSNKLLTSLSSMQFRYPAEFEGFTLLQEDFDAFMKRAVQETGSEVVAKKRAQKFIFERIKMRLVKALEDAIIGHKDLNKSRDEVVKYVLKHRFGFLADHLPELTDIKIRENYDPIEDVDIYTTLLHAAAQEKEDKIVKFLIECGVNLNVLDSNGATALHDAVAHDAVKVVKTLLNAPKILKNAKIGINMQDAFFGDTPLHFAVEYNLKDMAKILLEAGADRNITDKNGKKPIDLIELDEFYYATQDDKDAMYKVLQDTKALKR